MFLQLISTTFYWCSSWMKHTQLKLAQMISPQNVFFTFFSSTNFIQSILSIHQILTALLLHLQLFFFLLLLVQIIWRVNPIFLRPVRQLGDKFPIRALKWEKDIRGHSINTWHSRGAGDNKLSPELYLLFKLQFEGFKKQN